MLSIVSMRRNRLLLNIVRRRTRLLLNIVRRRTRLLGEVARRSLLARVVFLAVIKRWRSLHFLLNSLMRL